MTKAKLGIVHVGAVTGQVMNVPAMRDPQGIALALMAEFLMLHALAHQGHLATARAQGPGFLMSTAHVLQAPQGTALAQGPESLMWTVHALLDQLAIALALALGSLVSTAHAHQVWMGTAHAQARRSLVLTALVVRMEWTADARKVKSLGQTVRALRII